MRNLGRALSVIARQQVGEIIMHEDVRAWGAPSECHRDVERGEISRARQARRLAKSVSGMSRASFNRELRSIPARALTECVSRLYERMSPFVFR
jgi:hypothetical protein